MQVTVYSTPTCPYCHQVKAYLSQKNVPFKDVDVSVDQSAAADMVRISGQRGVPVVVVDNQPIVGFDRPKLDALLARASRPRLGAAVADAATMAAQGRCQVTQGAYVGRVAPESLAAQVGLRNGDVIISMAGQAVSTASSLETLLTRLAPNQRIPLEYVRDGITHKALIAT